MTSPTGMNPRKETRGFTFIELLIVTILLSVLVAVAIPRFRASYQYLQLEVHSGNIQSFINAIHELAILEGKHLVLKYDQELSTLTLTQHIQTEGIALEEIPYAYPLGEPYRIANELEVYIDPPKIEFNPDGSTSECTLRLKNRLGDIDEFRLLITGQIETL